MKKIPTLFKREFKDGKVVGITDEIYPGMEWVLNGEGRATQKFDGSCCAIIKGEFYKRFDAKPGREIPDGAVPCCDPDPVTGHHPHWVPVKKNDPADKWFMLAYKNSGSTRLADGTYEAVGPHFNGNNDHFNADTLIRHGLVTVEYPRSFEAAKQILSKRRMEGIVFWKDGQPQCKIKRSDFGLEWPIKENNA